MNCLVIACSQRKRDPRTLCHTTLSDGTSVAPAWAVYDGTQIRIVRKYAPYRALAILILSARFGLISPSHKIPIYDRRMTAAQAQDAAWIAEHIADRWTLVQPHTYRTVYTCLPRLYQAALISGLRPFGIEPVPIVRQGTSQGSIAQALKTFCLARRR
jgi:hypothetical protein